VLAVAAVAVAAAAAAALFIFSRVADARGRPRAASRRRVMRRLPNLRPAVVTFASNKDSFADRRCCGSKKYRRAYREAFARRREPRRVFSWSVVDLVKRYAKALFRKNFALEDLLSLELMVRAISGGP
jgi:hypothetical protein